MGKMVIVCNSDTSGVMPTMIMGASGVGIDEEVIIFFCPAGASALLKGVLHRGRVYVIHECSREKE